MKTNVNMLIAEKIFNDHRSQIVSEIAEFYNAPRNYVNEEILKMP